MSMLAGLFYEAPVTVRLADSFIPSFDSFEYPLGTDRLGRNVLALYAWGSLVTILLAIPARILTLGLSLLLSLLSWYGGRFAGGILQAFSSVFIAIPSLLGALVILQVADSGVLVIFLAIMISDWALVYETVQGKIREMKNSGYVTASTLMGAGRFWVFRRHILPAVFPVVYLLFVTGIPAVIMTLSIFSFLGVGMGAEFFGPGLGEQIAFSKDFVHQGLAPLLTPVLGILLMIYSFSNSK